MKKKNKITYKVGDTVEVETFAGPKVHKKVLSLVDRTTKWESGEVTRVRGFEGRFVRRKDLLALKEQCVPYTGKEKLVKTRSFTFDWQITKLIKSV